MESKKLTSAGLQLPVGKTAFVLAVCFTMVLLFLSSSTRSNFLFDDHTLGPIPSQLLQGGGGGGAGGGAAVSGGGRTERIGSETDSTDGEGGGTGESRSAHLPFKEIGGGKRIFVGDGGWLKAPTVANFTDRYIGLLSKNGSEKCHEVSTATVEVVGLPDGQQTKFNMAAGPVHEITLVSMGSDGSSRCFGGDYFETDLSSDHWKSRPPVSDNMDGTYSLLVQVHPAFSGLYRFQIFLTFSNFHGLHRRPERWFRNQTVLDVMIEFSSHGEEKEESAAAPAQSAPPECSAADFRLDSWAGRWTRVHYNTSCAIDSRGRYASCMNQSEVCDLRQRQWCVGPAALLESNGWVYSAHCSFRIFTQHEAWECLNGKWVFFWGDSNHVDTVRNLLNFALGIDNATDALRRRFDAVFRRPSSDQSVRITSFFNGHSNISLNHEGLYSLNDPAYRSELGSYFSGEQTPDAIIMNSGLHDGMFWRYVEHFAEQGVKAAAKFWAATVRGGGGDKKQRRRRRRRGGETRTRMIYRTTVAAAAWGRAAAFNPHKMEVYNQMMVEKLREEGLLWGVVDGMDMTYPWHYDNRCSDGVHYGKPPTAGEWYGGYGHEYFVDLMLGHVLLNAVCARE